MTEQPLSGPLARLERAKENIANLELACGQFIRSDPYKVVSEPDPKPESRSLRIVRIDDVPLRLRVMVGEIAHHLRCAFDLLAYQLMLQADVTDEKRLKNCEFPILTDCDLSVSEGMQKYKSMLGGKIRGVRPGAYARIERLQPCQPGNGNRSSGLAQIQELDNIDKHRLLLALVSSTKISGWHFPDGTGNTTIIRAQGYVPLNAGAVVTFGPVPPEMHVDLKLPPGVEIQVAFGEPRVLLGKPVVPTLHQLADFAIDTISLFQGEFT